MKKQKQKSAAELMSELEANPVHVQRQRLLDEERRRAENTYSRAEAPVVEDLHRAGVAVRSVWDLVNTPNTYGHSIPILLEHLKRPYPDEVREGIARAMAVPEAKFAWPALVMLYRTESGPRTKAGLAVAIGNLADAQTLDEVVALAREPRNGDSRVLLLPAFERIAGSASQKALMELGGEPTLHKEVQRILARLRRTRR